MNTRAEQQLAQLLARIHDDEGQYQREHGTEKAVADADAFLASLYTDLKAIGKEAKEFIAYFATEKAA